jgi:hypothetical protein
MTKEVYPLHLEMMAELAKRQGILMDRISGVIRDVTLIKFSLPLKQLDSSLNKADYALESLEAEALLLEKSFNEPTLLLSEQQKHELNANQTTATKEIFMFVNKVKESGEATDRRDRIYSLLDRLDRRISDRRSASQFRRTQYFAFAGVGIALFAVLISAISLARC